MPWRLLLALLWCDLGAARPSFNATTTVADFVPVTYATSLERLAPLQAGARWHGWSALHVLGLNRTRSFQTHRLTDKLWALRRFARAWPDDTLLAFVDGYDVLVNNHVGALQAAFHASGHQVLVASERGCCTTKAEAQARRTTCDPAWPFPAEDGPHWTGHLNSGVLIGYAGAMRRLLRQAWHEYLTDPPTYRLFTDQQLLCFLLGAEGSTLWTRASVGIDHASAATLCTYRRDLDTDVTIDALGRVVFDELGRDARQHGVLVDRQEFV